MEEQAEELGQFYSSHSKEIGECMACWVLLAAQGGDNVHKADTESPSPRYAHLLNISAQRNDIVLGFLSLSAHMHMLTPER